MKNYFKVFALILLISLTSCKDDEVEETPTPDTRFEKVLVGNDNMELLKDNVANLEWVNDNRGCFAAIVTPGTQCEDSMFAGKSDWRTPTPDEMSVLIKEIDKRNMSLNYINASCAVMSTSMATWVFTENSSTPGVTTTMMPGNAGLRCVRSN